MMEIINSIIGYFYPGVLIGYAFFTVGLLIAMRFSKRQVLKDVDASVIRLTSIIVLVYLIILVIQWTIGLFDANGLSNFYKMYEFYTNSTKPNFFWFFFGAVFFVPLMYQVLWFKKIREKVFVRLLLVITMLFLPAIIEKILIIYSSIYSPFIFGSNLYSWSFYFKWIIIDIVNFTTLLTPTYFILNKFRKLKTT